jgi:pimeloyl-ACP methyl ester carboxylesterase
MVASSFDREQSMTRAPLFLEHANGFRMHYEVYSNLSPIPCLFVHGHLSSNRWWYPTRDEFAQSPNRTEQALPFSHPFILAEWRGSGHSSWRDGDKPTIGELAEDYLPLLKKWLEPTGVIIGHSTGGLIALYLLALYPQYFRGALLLSPVTDKGVRLTPGSRRAMERIRTQPELLPQLLAFATVNDEQPGPFFNEVILPDGWTGFENYGTHILEALDQNFGAPKVEAIQQPVLIVHGLEDHILPVADARSLNARLPQSHLLEIPACGHSMNIQRPKEFAQILQNFLDQLK